jgi:NDP-sugar pyrophosphorylase family protein
MILCGWENKKSGEQIIARTSQSALKEFSFSGVQIVDPKIFQYFPDKDVFSCVEFYLATAKKEKIIGYIHNEDDWMDLGKMENIKKAESLFE